MKTIPLNKSKMLISGLSAILAVSVITSIYFAVNNSAHKKERDKAILLSDSILSSKLVVEKKLNQTTNELDKQKNITHNTENELSEAKSNINELSLKIESLEKENSNTQYLRKQLAELKKSISEKEASIAYFSKENKALNDNLLAANNSIQSYKEQLEKINKQLESARALKADNFCVKTLKAKRNQKNIPTYRASRTNKFSVEFDLMENPLALSGVKTIYLIIKDPKGKVLDYVKQDTKTGKKENTYSSIKVIDYKNNTQRVIVDYMCEKRLEKGIYSIEVYTDNTYSGKKEISLK